MYFENPKPKGKQTSKWHWVIQQGEIHEFLAYIKDNELKGKKKKHRIKLVEKYLKLKGLKAHLADEDTVLFKEWKNFCSLRDNWYNLN